jgi:hypothetical protein
MTFLLFYESTLHCGSTLELLTRGMCNSLEAKVQQHICADISAKELKVVLHDYDAMGDNLKLLTCNNSKV